MDQAAWAFLGVVLGGGITAFASWLNNRQAADREREQWERQHNADQEMRMRQDQAQEQERISASLQEVYEKALYYADSDAVRTVTDVGERSKSWNLLLVYYHDDRQGAEYRELRRKIDAKQLTAVDIVDLAARDPRLRISSPPASNQ